ncbi:MAG: hypothetical protein AB7E95_08360 [Kiritimatiellales bacterium]
MASKPNNIVTVIADSQFVLPVYILILSLKAQQPAQRIHVLGISLSKEEKKLFTQFENVFVFDSSIPFSRRPGAMRIIADILKGEALMTAKDCEEEWVALLDGDCIAVGDITPYLEPGEPALYARTRPHEEDDRIFRYYRRPGDSLHGVPDHFIQRWQQDVGQRTKPARTGTVLSGNLVLHRDFLDFSKVWKTFMLKVLRYDDPAETDVAYYMPAEFALSAWMMFAEHRPPLREVLLNSNPNAFLAHLGPAPKYWKQWTLRNLRHFDSVVQLIQWAGKQGYAIPELPYTLKKRNKPIILVIATAYDTANTLKRMIKRTYRRLAGNNPERQARRYNQQ